MARGINKVILVDAYASGMSIPEVARVYSVSRSTVRLALLASGSLRSRTEGVRLASKAGSLGSGMRGKRRVFTEAHKEAIRTSAIARGERDAVGVSVKPNGYAEVTRGPDKGRLLHRLIAEVAIGRPLNSDEVVHHKDHNKLNNHPSNLEVMTRAAHTSLHRQENI